ncbi:transferrin-binding protein-like solute binding protein [Paracoccus sp. CPCC 101403]|uniref:Transferrin-binding protein-like solute binding protein n=1 Tax=Paracoccus broussonetiae TaxID=3075834 RepID=A0ABU3EGG8_9RHOB|nr:transferrin-binding protein-like solute binding protein [Paracoccus sp. CPCC 101403]MDT1063347.1 transferrin-binding protein-like solute binding protein [Paracoccus sp. CPCC 101403]
MEHSLRCEFFQQISRFAGLLSVVHAGILLQLSHRYFSGTKLAIDRRCAVLFSCFTLAACGGGGGGSSSGAGTSAGFEGTKPANLTFAAVAATSLGSVSTSSNPASYDPKSGNISTGSQGFSGTVAEGQWRTDGKGNRLRMTSPAGTKFVRQVDMVEARGNQNWHRGVIGFETQSMPKSGKMTYAGTTSGQAMKFGVDEGPTLTDFDGKVRVQADIASGKGNYRISDVRATDGTSPAPFRSLSSDFSISGNRISSDQSSTRMDSGPGQPMGRPWHSVTNGAFYGPNAAEVGAGYQVMSTESRINGAFVAKR